MSARSARRRRSSGVSLPSGSTSRSKRCRNFSHARRVRALRSSVRLHEISAAIRLFMSLAAMGRHRLDVTICNYLSICLIVGVRAFTCRHARAGQSIRQFVRQLLTVRLLGGDRTLAAPANLDRAARLGVLGQVAVQRRAACVACSDQVPAKP